jgi:pSer/pThr/pTyr-binding forkhead associated (FHA) protein
MPEIIVKFADKVIERVVSEKERITIGRTSENDIVLDNRGVSRKHAQIEFSENGALLIDNDSLNGTFVNERKVAEQYLKDKDTITIGKFDLVFFNDAQPTKKMTDMDGTMVLNTKKQKDMVNQDELDKQIAREVGHSLLVAVDDESKRFALERENTTLGKSSFANIRVGGWFVAKVQAKITDQNGTFTLTNVGHGNKTKVNGEAIDHAILKNGDVLEVGKTAFRFIQR